LQDAASSTQTRGRSFVRGGISEQKSCKAFRAKTTPAPQHPNLHRYSGPGIAVPEGRSIAIDRVRRKRQRLPSCLLIENAPLACTIAAEPFAPGHFRSRLTTTRTLSSHPLQSHRITRPSDESETWGGSFYPPVCTRANICKDGLTNPSKWARRFRPTYTARWPKSWPRFYRQQDEEDLGNRRRSAHPVRCPQRTRRQLGRGCYLAF